MEKQGNDMWTWWGQSFHEFLDIFELDNVPNVFSQFLKGAMYKRRWMLSWISGPDVFEVNVVISRIIQDRRSNDDR